jgi:hypothetical protein
LLPLSDGKVADRYVVHKSFLLLGLNKAQYHPLAL